MKSRALAAYHALHPELVQDRPLSIHEIARRAGVSINGARRGVRDLIRAGVVMRTLADPATKRPPTYCPARDTLWQTAGRGRILPA